MPWTCPTCDAAITSAFCPGCGERPLQPRDLTVHGIFEQVFHAFSHFDSRVARSFRDLLVRPGSLTRAFQDGQRKPFIGPFQIFLLANVVFFALQSFSQLKIFTAPLAFRLQGQLWSELSTDLLAAHLTATKRTFAEYAPVFDQAVAVNAKSLIGLMAAPLALVLPFIFWRRHDTHRQPFGVHVVFALHLYAFLLLLFCVPLALMAVEKLAGGTGLLPQMGDNALSVSLVTAITLYLYFAIGPVYETRGLMRAAQAALVSTAVVGIFLVYRFVLFPITLYTT
jgi:hypothetical protein